MSGETRRTRNGHDKLVGLVASQVWRRNDTIVRRTTEVETQDTVWCSTRMISAKTIEGKKKNLGTDLEVGVLDLTRGAKTDIGETMMMIEGITLSEAEMKVVMGGIVTGESVSKLSPWFVLSA